MDTLTPSGRHRKRLIYTGEYYTFGLEKKKRAVVKATMLFMIFLLLVVYVLTFSLTQPAAPRIFVAVGMLIVIPLMYLLIGAGYLVPAGEKLTYRAYRGSVVRVRWTSVTIAVLAGLCVIGGLIQLLSEAGRTSTDSWWLAGMVFCCLDSLALVLLERRFRPRLIPPKLQ